MMILFVVTPSLDSIEHKFNSKSIKFPKLHKVPTLEAININKPWSEWKERLRNFGVKPPKRGIELGWVTRRTRLKKPSSSRGFARGARGTRGSWGSWGLKTENRTFFLAANIQKKFNFLIFNFYFFACLHGRNSPSAQGEREGVQREGEGKEMTSSARTGLCPHGCIVASARTRLCLRGRSGLSARTRSCPCRRIHVRVVAGVRPRDKRGRGRMSGQ
jgi:hypothetical protein